MRHNAAILVLSHVFNNDVEKLFKEIEKDCLNYYDVVFLCDNTKGVFDPFKGDRNFFLFTNEDLQSLKYPGRSAVVYQDASRADNPHHKDFNFIPGSTDLPILLFFKTKPNYDYYWIVEYDVRYSGSWHHFFSGFSQNDADLLGTTLTRRALIPQWYHWKSLDVQGLPIKKDAYIRGFFPTYRMSRKALSQLDHDYRGGVKGHYECLLPTILHHAGLRIEDIGGDGEFVNARNVNRYYRNTPARGTLSPGTFVFRPVMPRAGREPNLLWHPVKHMSPWQRFLRSLQIWSHRAARRIVHPLRK